MKLGMLIALFGFFTSTVVQAEDTWDLKRQPGNWELSLGMAVGHVSDGGLLASPQVSTFEPKLYRYLYGGGQWDVRYYPWTYFGFELSGAGGTVAGFDQFSVGHYLYDVGILSAGILGRVLLRQEAMKWMSLYLGGGLDFTNVSFDDNRGSLLPEAAKHSSVTRGFSAYVKGGYTEYLFRYVFWGIEAEFANFRARLDNLSQDLDPVYLLAKLRVGVAF